MRRALSIPISTSRKLYLHLYLALALLLMTYLILQRFFPAPAAPLQTSLQGFPLQIEAWKGTDETLNPEAVTILGIDDWLLRQYQHPSGGFVWFYVGLLGQLSFGQEALHSPQFCYPAQGWQPTHRGLQEVRLPTGQTLLINKLLVQKGSEQQLVLYWQHWGGKIVTERQRGTRSYSNELRSLRHVLSTLYRGSRTDRALVRISAPIVDSVDDTLAQAMAFIQAAFPLLVQHFALEVSTH